MVAQEPEVKEVSPPLPPPPPQTSPKRPLPNATIEEGALAKIWAVKVEQVSPMTPTSSAWLVSRSSE